MSYGLKVLNDNSQIIIDSIYNNYKLYEHGESVSTTQVGSTTEYNSTIVFATPTPNAPLVAIKPSSSVYCGFSHYTVSGSNYTGFVVNSRRSESATFDWQVFVYTSSSASEQYGLRIYNESATVVFDGANVPLTIQDIQTASPSSPSGGSETTATITHVSDATSYFIFSPHGRWDYAPGNPTGNIFLRSYPMMLYSSATQLNFGSRWAITGGAPPSATIDEGNWASSWTIIQVKKAF